jgi:hypothetical protein
LKASACNLITLVSCRTPCFSVSSTSSYIDGSTFYSSLASKVISISCSWHGFKVPEVCDTLNSDGKLSTPLNFHIAGIADTFFKVRVFFNVFPRRSRSNATTSWSTSITGSAPRT